MREKGKCKIVYFALTYEPTVSLSVEDFFLASAALLQAAQIFPAVRRMSYAHKCSNLPHHIRIVGAGREITELRITRKRAFASNSSE